MLQTLGLLTGISFLDSQAVGIVHPVASFRVTGVVSHPDRPSGLRKAGLPLAPPDSTSRIYRGLPHRSCATVRLASEEWPGPAADWKQG